MAKYMVVNFDRCNTEKSTYEHFEATSHKNALEQYVEGDVEWLEWMLESYIQVDEIFGCIQQNEENDTLIYKI